MAAVRAHLRLGDTHSGFCCLAALCIEGVLLYLLFNSSNLILSRLFNFLNFYIHVSTAAYMFALYCLFACLFYLIVKILYIDVILYIDDILRLYF